MIRIKIQYDKYDRTFKLVDKEFGPLLEDGGVYELIAPVIENGNEEELSIFEVGFLAHA